MGTDHTEIIETQCGKLRGQIKNGIAIYKGIPYAKPPVGDMRFKESVVNEGWEGVLDCDEFGYSAPQNPIDEAGSKIWTEEFIISNREFSEDCLTMNIWAPTEGHDLPVVLYFYGGGYVSGGSSCEIYDGTYLAKNGVIYVSFNHREGNLGLLCCRELSESSASNTSGNYMLSDGITALNWLRENIAAFGGDADNITIWGQSSGAGQVNALSISPKARGLFKKVISMGYNNYADELFLVPWKKAEDAYADGRKTIDEAGSLEKLKTDSWEDIIKYPGNRVIQIDGYYIKDSFRDGVLHGDSDDVSFMMGAVPGDIMMSPLAVLLRGQELTTDLLKKVINTIFRENAEKIVDFYDVDLSDPAECCLQIKNDLLVASMLWFAGGRNKTGSGDRTYLYLFDHPMPGPDKELYGAFHSCEVPYFMNYFSDYRKDYWTEADLELGRISSDNLISFIKTGKPLNNDFITSDGHNYYHINGSEQSNCIFPKDKESLWQTVFDRIMRNA
ncbi:MAG: carboxylesterase family protein [Lachnospiraceae bacterium]|nr:carboxylesterase family protein [Lachnospiraceae bacterium]